MNGLLSGAVAITAGCGTCEPWAAAVVGLVAGWIYLGGSDLLVYKWKIDDAVDAIPVHCFNGLWGILATGLFSSPSRMEEAYGTSEHMGFFYSIGQGDLDFRLLGNQMICALFVVGWPLCIMTPFFMWLNYMGWFRADSLEELVGLDMSYHGMAQASRPGGLQDADDSEVNEDDVKAFEQIRINRRRGRRGNINNEDDSSSSSSRDEDVY